MRRQLNDESSVVVMSKENFKSLKQTRRCRIRLNDVWKHIMLRRAHTTCLAPCDVLCIWHFTQSLQQACEEDTVILFNRREKLNLNNTLEDHIARERQSQNLNLLKLTFIRLLYFVSPFGNKETKANYLINRMGMTGLSCSFFQEH